MKETCGSSGFPGCAKVYWHVLTQGENRLGVGWFFYPWTAVLGTVPSTERLAVIVIDRGIGVISASAAPESGQMNNFKNPCLLGYIYS